MGFRHQYFWSPTGDFSLQPRLAPMCQEGPGDVKISDTAHALEGPDDLPGKTHQSLESRGRRPTSSWPVWWGEAALGFGPLRQCLPAFSQRKSCCLHDPLGSQDWPEWQAWGSLATLVGHRLGDSSVPGTFPPHPTLFFPGEEKTGHLLFFLQS